jgi:hypothetical protein
MENKIVHFDEVIDYMMNTFHSELTRRGVYFLTTKVYSRSHNTDMWYAGRLVEGNGKPDYYGPFFERSLAQKFIDEELKGKGGECVKV